jgi:hypothetical protein
MENLVFSVALAHAPFLKNHPRCNPKLGMSSTSSAADPDDGGFPKFSDGDVLIVSGTGKLRKLHSTTLRNASGKSKTLLDQTKARHITKKQKTEGKTIR